MHRYAPSVIMREDVLRTSAFAVAILSIIVYPVVPTAAMTMGTIAAEKSMRQFKSENLLCGMIMHPTATTAMPARAGQLGTFPIPNSKVTTGIISTGNARAIG